MTLTAEPEVHTSVAPAEELDEDLATPYDIVVRRIIDEATCSREDAENMVAWVKGIVIEIRSWDEYDTLHPTDRDMATPEYDLFDRIVKHGEDAQPGSAHEALQDAVLDRSLGELTLLHDDTGTEKRRHCGVTIGVNGS